MGVTIKRTMSHSKLILLLLVFTSIVSSDNSTILSRRKRYLTFPANAAIVMSFSLLKGIANDCKVAPTMKVITFHELDLFFPLPQGPSQFILSQAALGEIPVFHDSHTRQSRDIFRQLEDTFYLFGVDGRACILKTLCEARNIMPDNIENLMRDLLLIIFRLPRNMEIHKEHDYHVTEADCGEFNNSCPLSIFDIAQHWAEQYYNELTHNTN